MTFRTSVFDIFWYFQTFIYTLLKEFQVSWRKFENFSNNLQEYHPIVDITNLISSNFSMLLLKDPRPSHHLKLFIQVYIDCLAGCLATDGPKYLHIWDEADGGSTDWVCFKLWRMGYHCQKGLFHSGFSSYFRNSSGISKNVFPV